jgi:hypothetical protein
MINYTTYMQQISNLLVIISTDANFQTMLPGMIDFAEQKMYRELDLIATRVTDSTGRLTPGSNSFVLPTDVGTYLVVEQVNIITPITAVSSTGTRVPLVNASMDFIDLCYPANNAAQGVPEFFTMKDNLSLRVGPTPNSSYIVEVRGTQRPTPLSSGNSSTILTQMLPDAFICASMIFGSAYTRDFASLGDNPQQGTTWDQQYSKLMQSANVEELKKRYMGPAWTSQQPSPIATPPRV